MEERPRVEERHRVEERPRIEERSMMEERPPPPDVTSTCVEVSSEDVNAG